MKKVSIQKLSLLGLVLMVASTIAAAILPSKNKLDKSEKIGSCTASNDGGGFSCTETNAIESPCIMTESRGVGAVSGSTANSVRRSISNDTTCDDDE